MPTPIAANTGTNSSRNARFTAGPAAALENMRIIERQIDILMDETVGWIIGEAAPILATLRDDQIDHAERELDEYQAEVKAKMEARGLAPYPMRGARERLKSAGLRLARTRSRTYSFTLSST